MTYRENPVAEIRKGWVGVGGVKKTSGDQPNSSLRAHLPQNGCGRGKKSARGYGLFLVGRLAEKNFNREERLTGKVERVTTHDVRKIQKDTRQST